MEKIITVETMRKSDAYTIENFIDSKSLMYKAWVGVFNSYNWKDADRVAIVCGTGNNAGDGYVLALLLDEINVKSELFLIKDKFSSDGQFYFHKCREKNIPFLICDETTDFSEYTVIVDCIFGTGFKGAPRGLSKNIIERINQAKSFVISVDINSGLNGDTGMAEISVKSDLTVSIGYFKTGHFINDAPKYIDECVNCDIDIELIGQCFYLGDSFDIGKAEIYKNYNSFSEVKRVSAQNPVEAINNYTSEHKEKILIEEMGLYSVCSENGRTILFRR